MSTIVRPIADSANVGGRYTSVEWRDQTRSLPASWYNLVGDQSDATNWLNRLTPVGWNSYSVKLAPLPGGFTPATTGHKLGMRLSAAEAPFAPYVALLYQGDPSDGGSVIASFNIQTEIYSPSPLDIVKTIADDDIAAITDYDDLYIETAYVYSDPPFNMDVLTYELWAEWEEGAAPIDESLSDSLASTDDIVENITLGGALSDGVVVSDSVTDEVPCRVILEYTRDGGASWLYARSFFLGDLSTGTHLLKFKRAIRARRLMWRLRSSCGRFEILDHEIRVTALSEASDRV